jgi:hypothetical protein
MRISQTGPENNSALQNQNTENMSDEEEDDETIESFVWTSGRYYRFPGLAPFENRIGHVAIIKFYFYWYPI